MHQRWRLRQPSSVLHVLSLLPHLRALMRWQGRAKTRDQRAKQKLRDTAAPSEGPRAFTNNERPSVPKLRLPAERIIFILCFFFVLLLLLQLLSTRRTCSSPYHLAGRLGREMKANAQDGSVSNKARGEHNSCRMRVPVPANLSEVSIIYLAV